MASTLGVVVLAAGTVLAPDSAGSAILGLIAHVTLVHALALMGVFAILIVVGVTSPNRFRFAQRGSQRAVERRDAAGALVDGVPWQAAVSLIAVLAGIGWFAIGYTRTLPGIFGDELIRIELARDLANNGTVATHGYGIVSAAVDALAFRLTSNGVAAYHLIQVFNVAIMVLAAFPAYLLSRRALSHRWSLAVAAMTVAVPWMRYSAFVMTEPAFYPIFLLFLLALIRSLELPTRRRQAALALALGLALATRTQAVALAGAVVCAVALYGFSSSRFRETVRAFTATWVLYLSAGIVLLTVAATGVWNVLGAYSALLHEWHLRGFFSSTALNATAFTLSLGVLVAVAFPFGAATLLRLESTDGEKPSRQPPSHRPPGSCSPLPCSRPARMVSEVRTSEACSTSRRPSSPVRLRGRRGSHRGHGG